MSEEDDTYRTRVTLLERIKDKQDEHSWEEFVYYYKNFLYLLCRKVNLNHHDSEEIIQKVLLSAWKNLPEFDYDEKQNFRGWLCVVTKNAIIDFIKHKQRQKSKIDNATKVDFIATKNLPEIEKIAEEQWKAYVTDMAIDNLRGEVSDQLIDIFLKFINGATISSVSEELGLPPNTVSVYKKRIIAKLSKEIRRLNYELG